MKAYKGFNKDFTCRDYQYEVGKTHIYEGEIQICKQGFHACENPLDVLDTDYCSIDNKFCEVEVDGDIQKEDKKLVCSSIKLTAEIGFIGLFKAGIEWLKQVTNPQTIIDDTKNKNQSGNYAQIGSSGNSAQIGSSGDSAQIGSSGDSAQIGSSGNYAKIDSTGNDSVICCAGANSIVKAKIGSWITLAEWKYSEEKRRYIPICVKTEYVDGERIKENTWYKLENGEFKEC